jgi:hypothetical protein
VGCDWGGGFEENVGASVDKQGRLKINGRPWGGVRGERKMMTNRKTLQCKNGAKTGDNHT